MLLPHSNDIFTCDIFSSMKSTHQNYKKKKYIRTSIQIFTSMLIISYHSHQTTIKFSLKKIHEKYQMATKLETMPTSFQRMKQ